MPISQKSIDKMYQITKNCPCDNCSQYDFCRRSGNECKVYHRWVMQDVGWYRSRTPSHLASDVRTGSDRKVERIVRGMK